MLHNPLNTDLSFMISDETEIYGNIIEKSNDVIEWNNMTDVEHNADIVVKWINEFVIIKIFDENALLLQIRNKNINLWLNNVLNFNICKTFIIIDMKTNTQNRRFIQSFIIDASASFNVYIIQTNGCNETVNTVVELVTKIKSMFDTYELYHLPSGMKKILNHKIRVSKRKLTPHSCYITQLSMIPRISRKKAIKISSIFSSMQILLDILIKYSNKEIYKYMRKHNITGIGIKSINTIRYFLII